MKRVNAKLHKSVTFSNILSQNDEFDSNPFLQIENEFQDGYDFTIRFYTEMGRIRKRTEYFLNTPPHYALHEEILETLRKVDGWSRIDKYDH